AGKRSIRRRRMNRACRQFLIGLFIQVIDIPLHLYILMALFVARKSLNTFERPATCAWYLLIN
ncbi:MULTISPECIES: hypothetical protein, partial [unclassified Methylobacterium]|uniref:hypothetical protein n=1 Tax=unclassified Methylobacterium TaxID=2615210 RepID=UPI00226ACCC2